jgi:hypothetical protein
MFIPPWIRPVWHPCCRDGPTRPARGSCRPTSTTTARTATPTPSCLDSRWGSTETWTRWRTLRHSYASQPPTFRRELGGDPL